MARAIGVLTAAELAEQVAAGLSQYMPCGSCGALRTCRQCMADIQRKPARTPAQLELAV